MTDQPELNEQTFSKMNATSTVLGKHNMTVISPQFETERLEPGHLYFLNTQKLSRTSRLAQSGATMASAPRAVSLPDDLLIPYSPPLEDAFMPSAERIADAARASVRG